MTSKLSAVSFVEGHKLTRVHVVHKMLCMLIWICFKMQLQYKTLFNYMVSHVLISRRRFFPPHLATTMCRTAHCRTCTYIVVPSMQEEVVDDTAEHSQEEDHRVDE